MNILMTKRTQLVGLAVGTVLLSACESAPAFPVVYGDTEVASYRDVRLWVQEWGGLEAAGYYLEPAYDLPHQVPVWLMECGQDNAYYDPETRGIAICYELLTALISQFTPYVQTEEELAAAVSRTLLFIYYHEVAHALIHVLDLPVTGREEDASDQLATLILLGAGSEGRDAALEGAGWFWLKGASGAQMQYWDTHSLDPQRFYNVLCWVYGSDPANHQVLLTPQWGLPEHRALSCPAEYDRGSRAWYAILQPHIRE
jgi:hypothetical protein